jgi:transposase
MSGIEAEDKVVPAAEMKKLQERIRRLERLLGQKTEDVEILKEAIRIAREKKLISRAPLVGVEDFQ